MEVLPQEPMRKALRELYKAGVVTSTGGNISVRDGQRHCLISPKGMHKGDNHIVFALIDYNGKPCDVENWTQYYEASSEWMMHTELYKAFSTLNAVIHSHPVNATVLLTGTGFRAINAEAAWIGPIPTVAYLPSGTMELARAVAYQMPVRGSGVIGPAVFLASHGLVVVGSTLARAVAVTLNIERVATIILESLRTFGKVPELAIAEQLRLYNQEFMIG